MSLSFRIRIFRLSIEFLILCPISIAEFDEYFDEIFSWRLILWISLLSHRRTWGKIDSQTKYSEKRQEILWIQYNICHCIFCASKKKHQQIKIIHTKNGWLQWRNIFEYKYFQSINIASRHLKHFYRFLAEFKVFF